LERKTRLSPPLEGVGGWTLGCFSSPNTQRRRYIVLSFALILISLPSFAQKQNNAIPSFEEALQNFPRVEKNLRKWDAPQIADLDQDGFMDLLLNEHGFGVQICWNNNGQFAKPYDIIMGDLHGVSVGDFDKDGLLEIIMSRGGGSGSNARNAKIFRVDKKRNITEVPDFKTPLALMRGRTVKFFDGDNDGNLDLINFAFPDKEKKGLSENYIYKNDGNGQLITAPSLPPTEMNGQKTCLTDFNNDQIIDIILYGHKKVRAFKGKGDLIYEEVTEKIFPFPIGHVSGIVEFDFDNDGDFDLFITRGNEFEKGETFYDAQIETLGFFTKRGEFKFDNIKTGDVLNLENYHTQWPQTNQLYIGETAYDYEHPGETHSGKDLRLVNSDCLGFPDNFSEKGIYIGYVGNQNWRIAGEIWGPLTGVIHGVKEYPAYDHAKGLTAILLENKNGKFKDVTQSANLLFEEHTTGVAAADLDNNGWQDLIITRRGNLIHPNKSLVFMNYGLAGFEQLKNHKITSTELGAIGLGVETFDYNQDGKPDIVLGNERGKWHLFKNTSKVIGNYITVEIGNSPSGKATALGALVEIEGCRKKQIQRVGTTGAMYSQGFNHHIHFGLGACKTPIKIKVIWTNGERLEQEVDAMSGKIFVGEKL